MQGNNPKVSIIVSTFNRKHLLKKAIKSVLKQSLEDFECLVVDDFSTEDNRTLVKSFNDDRLRYIRTDRNYGFDSHPKNLGIKEAKGQYICFLDDDDTYRPDALRILYTYAKETEVDVVYGDYLFGRKPGWSVDFNVSVLTRMNFISMPVVMIKKESLLRVGGFDESVPKFKDWNLWLRLQKNGCKFLHIPIIVAEVSNQENSISNKYKVKFDDQGHYLPIIINEDGTEKELFNPADCKIWPDNTCLGERKPLKVAIYTLTMNRLALTKIMEQSIKDTADYQFDWFVIEQGSADGSAEWLKEIQKIRIAHWMNNIYVQYNEKNVGLSNGWNQAIEFIRKTGDYDIIIKIDNDAQMLTKGWLKAMVELFERNSTLVLSPYVEGLEKTPGGVLRQRVVSDNPYFILNETVLGNVPNLGGICFAHHIDLVKDWKFDPTYEGNKDYLLSQYAKHLGYSLFYCEELRVAHQLGSSGQKEKYPDYFKDTTNDSVKNVE